MNRLYLVAVFWGLCLHVQAQLSQGGLPIEIKKQKSAVASEYTELLVPAEVLLRNARAEAAADRLKPFRFAHAIPVGFSLENSGNWFVQDHYRIWQLKVRSEGAKTLNLVFDKYRLPAGAKLFLFSEAQDDLLGAFTSNNNQADLKFATSPVLGDKLIVQYEEPLDAAFPGELVIRSVNHDFVGIKISGDARRPLGKESGACNVNINCDYLEAYRQAGNSVCRLMVNGEDLCSGTLMNNTNRDGTPYIYTAAHCVPDAVAASLSVFLFNYESPYCGNIDGEINHSISGSLFRAGSDSLDFSLLELSTPPPASFRPYYAGWSKEAVAPKSAVSIHHPLGDIKKIAVDRNPSTIRSYTSAYVKNSFILVSNWEEGTTEKGSSGGPLINQDMRVVGSLTGGDASCPKPINDFYSWLGKSWDYYPVASKQLKAWLDPENTGVTVLDGLNPYGGSEQCGAFTNFGDEDTHENLAIDDQPDLKGYWGGTNSYGFTAFAEQFSFESDCEITGVNLGIAKVYVENPASFSTVYIEVYSGNSTPEVRLYTQAYRLRDFTEGVMNSFEFTYPVHTNGKFFIVCSIEEVDAPDSFALYLGTRSEKRNSFFIKDGGEWYSYNEKSGTTEGSSVLMEALLCGMDTTSIAPPLKKLEVRAYPNPAYSGEKLNVWFEETVHPSAVEVYDLSGRPVNVPYEQTSDNRIMFDFSSKRSGLYFITLVDEHSNLRYRVRISWFNGI